MIKKIFKKNKPVKTMTWQQEREIFLLEGAYKVITMACKSLRFDYNEELVLLLKNEYDYEVNSENAEVYEWSLVFIETDALKFLSKAEELKQQYYGK
ncbi:hypothetical protein ABGT15_12135 [Flavobacterium enshiense]|uniref:hypothetical protein n=1 Tax=Flavobacterium enshiense TaxID=1341165 RepID=UPI00345CCE2A